MGTGASGPLAGWRYPGTLRRYQQDVLDRVPDVDGDPLHVVAPPGSGKTLLGLLLAMRRGSRALVLAPTTTVRSQWARAASSLDRPGTGVVSEDPLEPGDLTVLTYQMLSVLEHGNPLPDLAEAEWVRELVVGGRDETAARAWIADLAEANPTAYRSGVRKRSRALRKRMTREDPALLAEALHPNAVELVDRLVAHGVRTIVLDECHHLLDHWALVVAYLASRVRAVGAEPLLVGLTATLPSEEDADAFENYTTLLGDVDYEVPTPAVVKEGNLAPYRDHVWFVEPSRDELAFLRAHEEHLAGLVADVLDTADGRAWLTRSLQPDTARGAGVEERLAAAFAADFALAEASARMLAELEPRSAVVGLVHEAARARPDLDQRIRLLARYALERILPDPAREPEWRRIKRTLVDLGYTLTDRGVRRGRDPVDTVLASSAAKDLAVGDVLRTELAGASGDRVRAVVVADFAVHGNTRGSVGPTAGALRTHRTLVADESLAGLRPVLVTAEHLRIAARDADVLLPALAEALGRRTVAEAVAEEPTVLAVPVDGIGSARVVAAVSDLLTSGVVRLVVGTRGLLGEGWDCPAANTLIDLTAVATSSATQQLRGRTLRLDPAWPHKVAHNWTVTAVVPARVPLDAAPDVARMRRKHDRIWGLLRADATQVVRGPSIALADQQLQDLGQLVGKARTSSVERLNAATLDALPSREESWRAWRVGEPYADREGAEVVVDRPRRAVFSSGPTLQYVVLGLVLVLVAVAERTIGSVLRLWRDAPLLGVGGAVVTLGLAAWLGWPLVRQLRLAALQMLDSAGAYRRVTMTVADALHRAARVAAFGHGDVRVTPVRAGGAVSGYEVEVVGGSAADRREVADAVAELFGAVRNPRFLLRVGRSGRGAIGRRPLVALAGVVARLVARRERYLPVPDRIGRRRADAEAFAAAWERTLGPCTLHEISTPDDLVLLARVRRQAGPNGLAPIVREQWS